MSFEGVLSNCAVLLLLRLIGDVWEGVIYSYLSSPLGLRAQIEVYLKDDLADQNKPT